MSRLLSRGLLLAVLTHGSHVAFANGVRPKHIKVWPQLVVADDDEEDGDDEPGSGKSGSGDDGDDEEGEDEDAKDQPPVTAGGLYTIKTYPVRENSRPLTLTQGIVQLRAGLGTDLSAKGAFESFGVNLEAIYGLRDNFNLIGGLTDAYNFKQFGVYFGFEGALYYDVVDIRVAANLHRTAIPAHYEDAMGNNTTPDEDPNAVLAPGYGSFCNPPLTPGEQITPMHTMCGNGMDTTVDLLPTGKYVNGGTQFSIDVGLPFRYAFRPEIAIIALYTLMSIDFNSINLDYLSIVPADNPMPGEAKFTFIKKGNGAKPDLKPSLGIATNPVPPLSIVIYAQLRIPDFDTTAGAFQIPVTGRLEFSPNQKFDVGLEFTLLNVKPPAGQSPIDNRFLSLFFQSRFGK